MTNRHRHPQGNDSPYSWEYRRYVAEEVAIHGKTIKQVAAEQGLDTGTVAGFHGAFKQGHYKEVIAASLPKFRADAVTGQQHVPINPETQRQQCAGSVPRDGPGYSSGITVHLPGGAAVIPQGADAATIRAVITALKSSGEGPGR